MIVVSASPKYCKNLGVVEGAGDNAARAREDALTQAAERGATHVRLDRSHLDLEEGMTTVVTGTVYACPSADEVFPPTGYP